MTTKSAEQQYLASHLDEWGGKGYVVFNPHGKPIEELPTIWGFNNGGASFGFHAVAIADDGEVLGGHLCSAEGYMPYDLGIVEGSRPERHSEQYQVHYPDGYRMDFVKHAHPAVKAAFEKHQAKYSKESA